MLNTEKKAYIASIKTLCKSRNNPCKGKVYIKDGEIRTAVNDSSYASFKSNIQGEGTYRTLALDTYLIDENADLSLYREDNRSTIGGEVEWGAEVEISKELGEKLIATARFASDDDTRPALMQTVIEDGWLMATDGYRATLEKVDREDVRFSPTAMKLFQKLHKYGNWTYALGKSDYDTPYLRLSNGVFTLVERMCEGKYPEMRKIADITDAYDTQVIIPVSNLLTLSEKTHTLARIELATGKVELGENTYNRNAYFATPLKANCSNITPVVPDLNYDKRIVIMPLNEEQGFLGVNLTLLKDLVDKSGNVELISKRGSLIPLIVL